MLLEQKIYAGRDFEAQKKLFKSFVLIGGECDENEMLWAGKCYCCLVD